MKTDRLAHPSGPLRFDLIKSLGSRISQRLTQPNHGTRLMTITHPNGSIRGERLGIAGLTHERVPCLTPCKNVEIRDFCRLSTFQRKWPRAVT